jgi:predicted RecB family nuclease
MERTFTERMIRMLTATHFYSYASCPRWAYLDMHGDRGQRQAPSEFLQKLLSDGRHHERAVLDRLRAERIGFDGKDVAGAAARTAAAMAAGVPRIAGAVLAAGVDGQVERLGVADLLERVPGHSPLGGHHYEVVEIKTARRVKPPYRMQLAFYSDLLAGAQGLAPQQAHLIMGDGRRESFPLAGVRGRFEVHLSRLLEIHAGHEPPVYISATCTTCPWRGVCVPQAEAGGHVSLVYGLQRETVGQLDGRGVRTCTDLARLEPTCLHEWTGCGLARARRLVGQARSLVQDGVVWRADPGLPPGDVELFFDIEGDPDTDALYLFGVLARDGRGERYVPFLAERPQEEARAFLACLEFLESYPEAPIYHYHHYERTALRRLVERYGVEAERVERLASRLRDLSADVLTSCYLPIRSYSLKSVARYLGFEWTHHKSSAVQSVVWFSSWLRTGDRACLEAAVEYNSDDCRATRVLKDWLASGPHGVPEAETAESSTPAAV